MSKKDLEKEDLEKVNGGLLDPEYANAIYGTPQNANAIYGSPGTNPSQGCELDSNQLDKVSGGAWSDFEVGKFYCLCVASKAITSGVIGANDRLGPCDTIEEAKEKGKEWSINKYNNGYTNITYSIQLWEYSGWNIFNELTYPE